MREKSRTLSLTSPGGIPAASGSPEAIREESRNVADESLWDAGGKLFRIVRSVAFRTGVLISGLRARVLRTRLGMALGALSRRVFSSTGFSMRRTMRAGKSSCCYAVWLPVLAVLWAICSSLWRLCGACVLVASLWATISDALCLGAAGPCGCRCEV